MDQHDEIETLYDELEEERAASGPKAHFVGMKRQGMLTEWERRRAEALELRVRGMSYKQIGDMLGITENGANKLVRRSLMRLREDNTERAEELRSIAHARLESLIRRLWLKAMPAPTEENKNPDLDYEAVRQIVRVIDTHSKIMGYAAPQKHQIDMNHLQSQIALVIEVVARALPDDAVPRVYEALEEAMGVVASRERSLQLTGS